MQFAHSGTESEKAFTAPRTTLQRRTGPTSQCQSCGAASVPSTVPRETLALLNRVLLRCPRHPRPWRQTRTVPRRFARAAPRCQAPRHPVASHPYLALWQQAHTSHSAAPNPLCPAPLWSCPESQKQKIGLSCNFFAIADCRKAPQSPIGARKCSENSSFALCRNREGSAIAKKLQKSRKFCFCNELIAEAEADSFKRLNARTGQISRWGESRKRRAKPAAERQVARDAATSDKSRF